MKLQRGEPGAASWLPPRLLREPASPEEHALAEAVGAITAFIGGPHLIWVIRRGGTR